MTGPELTIQNVAVDSLKHDTSIYPREKPVTLAIRRYVDAIQAGEELAPIHVEAGTYRILDGYHRVRAYKECGIEIVNAYVVALNGTPALLYAASLNTRHGVAMSYSEMKDVARATVEKFPDITNKAIAEMMGIKQHTVTDWVKDLRAAQTAERDMLILRLSLLGWTQEEIGEVAGITRQAIGQLLQENAESGKTAFTSTILSLSSAGHDIATICERTALPELLVRAVILRDKSDEDRLRDFKIGIQPYDVWTFSGCDPLFGAEHPGRIPGQLVAHILYFFTEPGALVLDPMGGSGTTNDVCLAMGRRCYSYDIDARHERPDIIAHNIYRDGWPERIKKADLIFWDPPYFRKMDSTTIGDDGYIEDSISKLARDEYLQFFADALASPQIKKGTRLAFLMSDWDDNTDKEDGIFIWDYADLLRAAGWRLLRHIQAPLSTQQVHPDIVTRFRQERRLARLERYLLIAER